MKNPKKVQAGQKGAASRKAKYEQLLAELQRAKASLANTKSAVTQTSKEKSESRQSEQPHEEHSTTSWSPYIVGGLGIACALWLMSQHKCKEAAVRTSVTSKEQKIIPSVKQLNIGSDPFYMQ